MNPISIRLLSQQLASPQFKSPAEVVSWFGAMQGQDYKMMRWAVGIRMQKPSYKAFEVAYNEGQIIRAHLFRFTWQLVSGEDYGWMLNLCSDKANAANDGYMRTFGISVPCSVLDSIYQIIADTLSERRSAGGDELLEAVRQSGISIDDHTFVFCLRRAEFSGLICSGDLHPTRRTYALSSSKIRMGVSVPADEAITLLAEKYFRSHAPATLEDFVWWSGLNAGLCRRGVSELGSTMEVCRHRGRDYYIHESCRRRGFRSGNVLLLPAYDEYLIGYKSRDVVLHPEYAHRAHNKSGIFHNVIAFDGKIVGNWSPSGKDMGIDIFKDDMAISHETLQDRIAKYQAFLNK